MCTQTVKCLRCDKAFVPEVIEGYYGSVSEFIQDKLCYHCFEEGLEEWEERRRRKIAERNEY